MTTSLVADGPMARGPVLVVDDEPAHRKVLQMILELEGHRVTTASNGTTALAAAAREPPAVVLLDLVKPQVDGYQTEAALHALLPEVPVVFMLSRDRVWPAAAEHHAAGASPKPFKEP